MYTNVQVQAHVHHVRAHVCVCIYVIHYLHIYLLTASDSFGPIWSMSSLLSVIARGYKSSDRNLRPIPSL